MITGVAFVPQAPALVPELGRGLDAELGPLRTACATAIRRVSAGADRVLLIGAGPTTRMHPRFARGSLAGFGLAGEVQLGGHSCGGASTLSPALTVAAHALHGLAGVQLPAYAASVADGLPDEVTALAADDTRWALVIAGDGSARRSEKAPGYLDERATAWDAQFAADLASGQGDRLHAQGWGPDGPPGVPEELLVAGARVWDEVAFLLEAAPTWNAELLYDDAPFGVGYFVAAWTVGA